MGNKRYRYHDWWLVYPEDMQIFADQESLLITSIYTRKVLGQVSYSCQEQGLKVLCPAFDLGFSLKNKELHFFFSGYALQFS
ncbi:hypothetical protein [Streptococcus cuniculipharyngis]|uniref:Uncharacterized protein n=1 Tax=Streptococcus cuniculipharyngis TaxID=1562651 RepID=A0A5C5SB38_9STRE|nr:hypothetical protein [Streptococcus cuniculipharyngis]TWS96679.1 hypothetical protein FRX57_06855 [Streptococcus cuniculipharyngis]